jgi:hypothetical protein
VTGNYSLVGIAGRKFEQGVFYNLVLDICLTQFVPEFGGFANSHAAEISQKDCFGPLEFVVHFRNDLLFAFLIHAPSSFLLV